MPLTILYAEDHRLIAEAVTETLEAAGWRVDACADGAAALVKLEGAALYDLLLLDNDLPGVSGLELARRARSLPHRRRTPIIVISGGDAEAQARGAGADAFLRKPQDVGLLVETIARLLDRGA